MQLRRFEHLITVAVAVACVGLALAEGGFPPTAFAATALIVWTAVVIGLATGVVAARRAAAGAAIARRSLPRRRSRP